MAELPGRAKKMADTKRPARPWLLAMGALLGIALAAHGVVAGDGKDKPVELAKDVVARVNGKPVARADFERALAAVAATRQGKVSPEVKQRVLDRLIDEELLVQRGMELGLAERDRKVRRDLSAAVIDLIVARGRQQPVPNETKLRQFYEQQGHLFSRATALRLEHSFVRQRDGESRRAAASRAEQLRQRLADGQPWSASSTLSDLPPAPLPTVLLPLAKLRDYLGPSVTKAAAALPVGSMSLPIEAAGNWHIIRVRERKVASKPQFETIRAEVLAEWQRSAGSRRLRDFLERRRAAATIDIAESL